MKDEIINAASIREAVDEIEGSVFGWVSETELRCIVSRQNKLLTKAADRIEELETGIRNLLKKYQNS